MSEKRNQLQPQEAGFGQSQGPPQPPVPPPPKKEKGKIRGMKNTSKPRKIKF